MKKGVKFSMHQGGQNAVNIRHKASPKYTNISMDVRAKWQLKIFAPRITWRYKFFKKQSSPFMREKNARLLLQCMVV